MAWLAYPDDFFCNRELLFPPPPSHATRFLRKRICILLYLHFFAASFKQRNPIKIKTKHGKYWFNFKKKRDPTKKKLFNKLIKIQSKTFQKGFLVVNKPLPKVSFRASYWYETSLALNGGFGGGFAMLRPYSLGTHVTRSTWVNMASIRGVIWQQPLWCIRYVSRCGQLKTGLRSV